MAFNIRSLPRCVVPFRFTRSYSRRCVRRRVFGKENELTFVVYVATTFIYPGTSCLKTQSRLVIQPSVQKKSSTENRGKTLKKEFQPYCEGDSAGVSSVAAGASVVAAGACSIAAGLVSAAAGGGVVGVGLVAGVTVSVFCSHAAKSAATDRMQMYFFIVGDAHCFN
jgi:Flp pilus assembly protein TadB